MQFQAQFDNSEIVHVSASDFAPPETGVWHVIPPHPEEQPQVLAARFLADLHRARTEKARITARLEESSYVQLLGMMEASGLVHGETRAHMLSVGVMSAMLAAASGASNDWCSRLERAAALHDLGKIGQPPHPINGSTSLSAEERSRITDHSELGAKILGNSAAPLMQLAAEIALSHHERWDGSGYPRGLAGENIPLAGRIVAITDFIDKSMRDRPYRKARGENDVFEELAAQSGRRFDPALTTIAVSMQLRFAHCRKTMASVRGLSTPLFSSLWQQF